MRTDSGLFPRAPSGDPESYALRSSGMHRFRWLLFALLLFPLTAEAGDNHCRPGGQALNDWVEDLWVSLANVQPNATDVRLAKQNGATAVWNYTAGWGWNRTDLFAVEVTLPKNRDGTEKISPRQILDTIRDDPTSLGTNFPGWVKWRPAGKGGRQRGEIVDLNIWGPDNGAISYLDVDTRDGDFQVITVQNSTSGTHPVSGVRRWGFNRLPNGNVLFYTVGIESSNTWGSGDIGSHLQYKTWRDLMRDIGKHVQRKGGTAHKFYIDDEWQASDLKPGRMTRKNLDNPGTIDMIRDFGFFDRIEDAEAQMYRDMHRYGAY